MAPKVVSVPLAFGLGARIDPKLSPFGLLKRALNLRIRKDGRIGSRNGYVPLPMTTPNGTLFACDLHEYQGRLIALGSDGGDDSIVDLYEYTGLANAAWRGTDKTGTRVTVNPFTAPREVAGIVQPEGGCEIIDAACGDDHVCLIYNVDGSGYLYALIVNARTNQTVHQEELVSNGGFLVFGIEHAKVTFARGAFYVAYAFDPPGGITIKRFEVGVSTVFTSINTTTDNLGSSADRTAFDFITVGHVTLAAVAIAFQHADTDLVIKVLDESGVQVGTTCTVSGTSTVHLAIEADEADNTINLYTVETADTGQLRTFDFSGALLNGPTAVTDGETGSLCRLFAQGGLAEDSVAVVVNGAGQDITIQVVGIDSHTELESFDVNNAFLRSRPLGAQSPSQDIAVVFAALVVPVQATVPDDATNALFFATPDASHMTTRDFVRAKDHRFVGLQSLNGQQGVAGQTVAWVACRDPGVQSLGVPVVTLVDVLTGARRKMANYGGLLYIAGSTPLVYDGRMLGELGFAESPGIQGLTPSNAGGSLIGGATYYYTVHWEIVLADGSLMTSPVSVGGNRGESITDDAASVTLGAGHNRVSAVVSTPHSVRTSMREALFGATIAVVLSRTQWIELSTKAALLGTRDFSAMPAAAGTFSGLTLELSVSGGGTQTVTFGATDEAVSELVAAINAQTTGITASVVGGSIFLQTDAEGSSVSIAIVGGTTTALGAAFIGFLPGDNAAGETSGAPGSTLHRCAVATITFSSIVGPSFGGSVIIVDTLSDDDLADNEALYTQGERGALSGPLEQHAPRGCAYLTATESRLLTGGLARPFEVQISRSAFLSEAFSFSEFSSFFTKASGPVMAVESLDQAKLIFTSDAILSLGGEGPDDIGGGALDPPVELPTPSGLKTAWSLLKGPDGLWFQLDDNKLFRIPRGGGSPTWEGIDVRDLLDQYPNIVGAARHKRDNCALFACYGSGGGGRQTLVRDFRTEQWLHDLTPDTNPIAAITQYGDSVAYALRDGVVYVQSTTTFVDGVDGSFIETELELHPIFPFGVGGYGLIHEFQLTGEVRGDSALEVDVTYDDGQTFALTGFDLLESEGYGGGTPYSLRWSLPQNVTSAITIVLRVRASDSEDAVLPSEGLVFNEITLLVEREEGLRELSGREMA